MQVRLLLGVLKGNTVNKLVEQYQNMYPPNAEGGPIGRVVETMSIEIKQLENTLKEATNLLHHTSISMYAESPGRARNISRWLEMHSVKNKALECNCGWSGYIQLCYRCPRCDREIE